MLSCSFLLADPGHGFRVPEPIPTDFKGKFWRHHGLVTSQSFFPCVPVLTHPNPNLSFVVEVGASDGSVTVLAFSGWPEAPPLYLLLPGHISAEANYSIRNCKLLAIFLALQEWRHWLERSKEPFTVFIDHKDLLYVRSAKRFNSRQAWWALLFTRFNGTLTCCKGSRNQTLSHGSMTPWLMRPSLRLSCPASALWEWSNGRSNSKSMTHYIRGQSRRDAQPGVYLFPPSTVWKC